VDLLHDMISILYDYTGRWPIMMVLWVLPTIDTGPLNSTRPPSSTISLCSYNALTWVEKPVFVFFFADLKSFKFWSIKPCYFGSDMNKISLTRREKKKALLSTRSGLIERKMNLQFRGSIHCKKRRDHYVRDSEMINRFNLKNQTEFVQVRHDRFPPQQLVTMPRKFMLWVSRLERVNSSSF